MVEEEIRTPVLVPYKCPICGKLVAWAISRAQCRCPDCKKWFAYCEASVSAGA
ncbi:hypothetical protein [Dendrosporobacter sp. 1207_IL3150]|uniref:hypothetical protein n=1 Tax=Dendrosporobacter sp. 1207_IL3150 TaxID=3084054 RepID=UPI002FD9F59E